MNVTIPSYYFLIPFLENPPAHLRTTPALAIPNIRLLQSLSKPTNFRVLRQGAIAIGKVPTSAQSGSNHGHGHSTAVAPRSAYGYKPSGRH